MREITAFCVLFLFLEQELSLFLFLFVLLFFFMFFVDCCCCDFIHFVDNQILAIFSTIFHGDSSTVMSTADSTTAMNFGNLPLFFLIILFITLYNSTIFILILFILGILQISLITGRWYNSMDIFEIGMFQNLPACDSIFRVQD